jgi:KAP family P-loop domain
MSKDAAGAGSAPTDDAVKILIDSPSVQPKLGFGAAASALAQIIRDSPPRFAVGIFGDWGSGKTTLMDAIRRELGKTVVSVEFNAWRYEREPQLLIPLLDTVRGDLVAWAANKDADTRKLVLTVVGKVARIIRGLAAGLSGEVGLPGAVKVKYDVGKSIDALTMSAKPEQPQSLYVAAYRELEQAFADLRAQGVAKIVVFVDDLDRCLPDNALDVLESMKLFFDLLGFVFVVGLDEAIVQRAVRTRFTEAPSLAAGTTGAGAAVTVTPEAQLAMNYVKKIFQVPYRLPPVVTGQLHELLEAMYNEAELESGQREDFRSRAEPHLSYLAMRGRVNPREVKRFLNTYTLQTLVRPELERDVVLPLQTLNFRYDWQVLYDAILIDSMLFRAALTRFRDEDDRAFEDLSPDLGTVQEELAAYLRSDAVAALAGLADEDSLDPYVTSLESTGRTPPWLAATYGEIGRLRREIRRIRGIESPTDTDRDALGRIAREVGSVLEPLASLAGLPGPLQEIRTVTEHLLAAPQSDDASAAQGQVIANSLARLDDVATRIYQALRIASSAVAPAVG